MKVSAVSVATFVRSVWESADMMGVGMLLIAFAVDDSALVLKVSGCVGCEVETGRGEIPLCM